jgi:hypothetical protein
MEEEHSVQIVFLTDELDKVTFTTHNMMALGRVKVWVSITLTKLRVPIMSL